MMDFETAAKNAIFALFRMLRLSTACSTSAKASTNEFEKKKMKPLWSVLDIEIVLRCLPALAFLPAEEVENAFTEIQVAKNDLIRRPVIPGESIRHVNKFFAYFERSYIRRPNGNEAIYPTSLWNMHERSKAGLPSTNNGVENWNGQFNDYFRQDNPPLADVIFKLQTDEQKTRQNIEIRARNPMPRVTGGMRSQKAIFSGNQI